MATRALTYLMEALPNTCPMLIHMGAVPLLCSKLLVIAYDTIDVAEQALSVLHNHTRSPFPIVSMT